MLSVIAITEGDAIRIIERKERRRIWDRETEVCRQNEVSLG